MARASGLSLLASDERDAWRASTRGTGELIVAAVAAGARTVIVAVGGSATTDGGAGCLQALEEAGVDPRLEVVCDVRIAWEDAPRVFGPQKGADAGTVKRLERRLDELATQAPCDPRGVPMTGAAGGLSGGLFAFRGGTSCPGRPTCSTSSASTARRAPRPSPSPARAVWIAKPSPGRRLARRPLAAVGRRGLPRGGRRERPRAACRPANRADQRE